MSANDVTIAVLDTNIWLDWLVFEDPAITPIRREVQAARLQLIASARLRDELEDVLGRASVRAQARVARQRRGLAPEPGTPGQLIAAFDQVCRLAADGSACGLHCTDPDDQYWLDLAVAHRARWLISKDRALLKLAGRASRRFGLGICVPAGFHGCGSL